MFLENVAIDGDDPSHIQWIYDKAIARANVYSITGVTYRLTQGKSFYYSTINLISPAKEYITQAWKKEAI